MKELSGRVAVVTGGASGIGRALVDAFADRGMRIVVGDIEQDSLEETVSQLTARGTEAIGVKVDVSREEDVRMLADVTLERFGAVHVLCNNAGVESGGRFADVPVATWRWVMDVNFWGVLFGCRTFLPLIREQDEGHIVNTGSVLSFAADVPTFHPYIASKFAILGLSESLDQELRAGDEPIGVSLLAPGVVRTNMPRSERNRPSDVETADDRPGRAEVRDGVGRLAAEYGIEPAHVADLVVRAILSRSFFVLTHPDFALVPSRDRLRRLDEGVHGEGMGPGEYVGLE